MEIQLVDFFVRGNAVFRRFRLILSARLLFRFLGTAIFFFEKQEFFTTLDFSPSPVTFEDVRPVTDSLSASECSRNSISEWFYWPAE